MHPIVLILVLSLIACCSDSSTNAPVESTPSTVANASSVESTRLAASEPAESAGVPAAEPAKAKPTYDPALEEPLSIDGQLVPQEKLQSFLVWGLGTKQVDHEKFAIILRQELDRRAAAAAEIAEQGVRTANASLVAELEGQAQLAPNLESKKKELDDQIAAARAQAGEADRARYVITDADLKKQVDKAKNDFQMRYPTLDYETEVGRAFMSVELYKEQATQSLLFDRLFCPDNPDEWPPLTTEAIISEGGLGFVEDARIAFDMRTKRMQEEGLPDLPPDDPIWIEYLRTTVLETLNNFSVQVTDPEQIGADTVLTVDGEKVALDPLWQKIRQHVTPEWVNDAKRFCVTMELARRDLAASGHLIPRAQFESTWVPGKSFQEAVVYYQMLALTVLGFPSMEAYTEYAQAFESFKKRIESELKDDRALTTVMVPCTEICAAAKCEVEAILASAYDDANVRWKPDGWAYAEKRIQELKQKLDGGADWTEMLELDSEFWDPPMPEVGQTPQFSMKFKGRFGMQTRNQLLGYFTENEFRLFLDGTCITDTIFFEQKVGTILGPIKGTRGWCLVKLTGKQPPVKPLNILEPKHRELLVNYYAKEKFNAWARSLREAAVAEGRVKGI